MKGMLAALCLIDPCHPYQGQIAIKCAIRMEFNSGANVKAIIVILLLAGMSVFQSNRFSGEFKVLVAILGFFCFVGLIGWSIYAKKKGAIDPTLMLNDTDVD
jgi:hypothetical protein